MPDVPKTGRLANASAPPPTVSQAGDEKVRIVVTDEIDQRLQALPSPVRNGLLAKLKAFALQPDIGRPLTGELDGSFLVIAHGIQLIVRVHQEVPIGIILLADLRCDEECADADDIAMRALNEGGSAISDLFSRHLRAFLEENRRAIKEHFFANE